MPEKLSWDGKTDSGAMSPEGTTRPAWTSTYSGGYAPGTATSPSFILD